MSEMNFRPLAVELLKVKFVVASVAVLVRTISLMRERTPASSLWSWTEDRAGCA